MAPQLMPTARARPEIQGAHGALRRLHRRLHRLKKRLAGLAIQGLVAAALVALRVMTQHEGAVALLHTTLAMAVWRMASSGLWLPWAGLDPGAPGRRSPTSLSGPLWSWLGPTGHRWQHPSGGMAVPGCSEPIFGAPGLAQGAVEGWGQLLK